MLRRLKKERKELELFIISAIILDGLNWKVDRCG